MSFREFFKVSAQKSTPLSTKGRPIGLLLAAFLFSLTLSIFTAPNQAEARYASVVMDSRTGQVLYSRNGDKKLYPASLTKIMTLYMTFEALERGKLKLDQKLKVSARAAGQTPTKLGLKRGSYITVRDAMFGLITKSANDAATVLAEAMAPTEAKFAQKMTDKARRLGMTRTSFRNASGLPNRRQKSTAKDMALLGAAMIHDFPQYYHFLSLQSFNYKGKRFKNHNNLLGKYSGADGIKTGYIRASGFNLVASAKRGDNRVIGVVFGGRTAKSRDLHMAKLLDKGFDRLDVVRPFTIPKPSKRPMQMALGKAHSKQTVASTPTSTRRVAIVSPVASAPKKPIPAPLAVAVAKRAPKVTAEAGNWGIQVGAFSRVSRARDQLNLAASRSNGLSDSGQYKILKVSYKGTPVYRAQMTGFSKTQAQKLCKTLQKQSVNCYVVVPKSGNLMRVALK